jgi:catechol 2,3-dioxygenase-like lactoylglutathione lyase family enzyme
MTTITAIDHVQIAIPKGGEDLARGFYAGVLGLVEVPKPPSMALRGGAWYQGGGVKVHLGVEADFRANDKAHVAFAVTDVAKHDDELPDHIRAFLYDPFGNRIEILQPIRGKA